jgi:thiol-disulfide isomerase/thioredoxin
MAHLKYALPFLMPALVMAQPSSPGAQALVAKYTELLKSYPNLIQDCAAKKTGLPREAKPETLGYLISHETDPESRQVLALARYFMFEALRPKGKDLQPPAASYCSAVQISSMLEVCGQMTPTSPALDLVAAVQPEFLGWIAWHASGGGFIDQTSSTAATKAFIFYDQIISQHPSRQVKRMALESCIDLYSRPRDIEGVRKTLARLEAFEPTAPSIPTWKKWIVDTEAQERCAPRAGQTLPDFHLDDLEHPGTHLTPATFKGKYWLLDFWATWCGPCRKELPYLHKAYTAHHPAGLEILSVSSDLKASDIQAFRKSTEHPMPWHHALPTGKVKEDLVNRFQVRGIPHIILVAPDGKILAMDEPLRGNQLEETLAKYLPSK